MPKEIPLPIQHKCIRIPLRAPFMGTVSHSPRYRAVNHLRPPPGSLYGATYLAPSAPLANDTVMSPLLRQVCCSIDTAARSILVASEGVICPYSKGNNDIEKKGRSCQARMSESRHLQDIKPRGDGQHRRP